MSYDSQEAERQNRIQTAAAERLYRKMAKSAESDVNPNRFDDGWYYRSPDVKIEIEDLDDLGEDDASDSPVKR